MEKQQNLRSVNMSKKLSLETQRSDHLFRALSSSQFTKMCSNEDPNQQSNLQNEDNAFVLNNYDIVETFKNDHNNIMTYLGCSFLDNEFYQIKRKRVNNIGEDISNKEQIMLQSCNHEHLTKYVMSFYLNRSVYIFLTASSQTLEKQLPIKNTRKGLSYFIQICKAVKYLHDKNLVYGAMTPNQIYLSKAKAQLAINNIYDINKHGAQKYFEDKRKFYSNQLYLPPEEQFSQQGDVWSLGILFHEVLTGLLPFNQRDGRFQILEECIDPFLTKILQRALRRDPQIRIKLTDMILDLENYANNYKTVENSFASLNLNNNVDGGNLAEQFNQLLQDITISTIAHPSDETTFTKTSLKNDLQALQAYYQKNGYPQSKLG
ncbi:agc family protein kinase [Stylonychia lemnae]|uniref:Agc family protein kinase n=1 Tax=Stylonychia lemnae TaxID=5949 RepID=A0A078AXB1_STYLE|nr:agc family protein kinase [Stylonychia lemnae]|eukprot:CDW87100.1 agc family protein kinase [Stylonychia lemnae]